MTAVGRTISRFVGCACILAVAPVHADEPPNDPTPEEPAAEPSNPSVVQRLPQRSPSEKGGAARSFDTLTMVPTKERRYLVQPSNGNYAVGWALISTGIPGILSAFVFRAFDTQGTTDLFYNFTGKRSNEESAPFSHLAYPVLMGVTSGALLAIGAGLVIRHLTTRAVSTETPHFPVFRVSVGPAKETTFGIQYSW